jgi:hypothetical protein
LIYRPTKSNEKYERDNNEAENKLQLLSKKQENIASEKGMKKLKKKCDT